MGTDLVSSNPSFQELKQQLDSLTVDDPEMTTSDADVIEVPFYPEDRDVGAADDTEAEIEALVELALRDDEARPLDIDDPAGYVSNARNAVSKSDLFHFWAPAEATNLGIGSLVHHQAADPATGATIETYGIVTNAGAHTLGLDDFAVHVYEQSSRPPTDSIAPSLSRRRPVVSYEAKVLSSSTTTQRPVLSGPVYEVKAEQLGSVHGRPSTDWPGPQHILLGFYEDREGEFGAFAEERARVLGPKQGHVIFSGLPGAGKTSLFLTTVIALYAQLSQLESENSDEER